MQRTVLLSFAHPDDESFYAAGTIARYRSSGVRFVLCCATRGERGSRGEPELCSIAELPRMREQELRRATESLGIERLHLLDYEDQKLKDAQPEQIRRQIGSLIRLYRPEVIVTFDPNGGNNHSDHVAISRFTMDAARAAEDPRWQWDLTPYRCPRLLWTPAVQPWRLWAGGDPHGTPGVDFLMDVTAQRPQKRAALACHRTQAGGVHRVFLDHEDAERRLGWEAFRQAWGPELAERPSSCLFDGVAA